MNIRVVLTGLFLVAALTARAQIQVDIVLNQEQFLPNESLLVGVRIANISGQTLKLAQEPDWLQLNIESVGGKPVFKYAEIPTTAPFEIESSKMVTHLVDVAPLFELTQQNRYRVTAILKIPEWGQSITSLPSYFDIIRGHKIWDQDFGVPRSAGDAAGAPEVRKFTLIQANYLKQLMLYVRLSDPQEVTVYRVFPLGPVVSFSKPEVQFDKKSQLHVLYQTGARTFLYCIISPDGQVVSRQSYDYSESRPTLRPDGEGGIRVRGGARRYLPNEPRPEAKLPLMTNQGTAK